MSPQREFEKKAGTLDLDMAFLRHVLLANFPRRAALCCDNNKYALSLPMDSSCLD